MIEDQAKTMTEMARRMQALFNPNETATPGLEQMLRLQQEMARQTETFTRHWLERRQEAVETGVKALHEMSAAEGAEPAGALRALSDWQRGSFQRLTADMQESVALWTRVIQTADAPGDTTQDIATSNGTGRPETRTRNHTTPSTRSEHATPV